MGVALLVMACGGVVRAEGVVGLTLKDVNGSEVKVPGEGVSVLVFVRMDQVESKKMLEQVGVAIKGMKSAQAVAVVGGETSAVDAAGLAKGGSWAGAVVSDPEYVTSGKMSIYAWPSAVVMNAAGEVVAHIGGYPSSFATDLAADLEFAAGKIDKATLEQRTAAHEVVADSADQKAGRNLEVARRLLAQGIPDAARVEIAKALEYGPKDAGLKMEAVKLMVTLADVKGAEDELAKVDTSAVPAAQVNLVRGQIALQEEKWDEAEKLLAEAVKLNPNPAEAWYGLGLVYKHKQEWVKAAEAFEKAYEAKK